MRKHWKHALGSLAVAGVAAGALGFWGLAHSFPPQPALAGRLEPGVLEQGGRRRTWIAYLPARPEAHPALVLVLHGSMGSGARARQYFGYDFDLLADHHGFLAVYPQGVEGHWNDCRVKGPFAAKRENVDDVGFLQALVDRLVREHGADPSRVFVTGVSNGGAMTLRLALQSPGFARAYAPVLASLPAPGNLAVAPKRQPVSILFMNATDDPFNPWGGGEVVLHGVWGNRGRVLSTEASLDTFRRLAGLEGPPVVVKFPDLDVGDGSTAELSSWTGPGKRSVALCTLRGGGHTVPHPAMNAPRLLGRSNRDIHAAQVIWDFFRSAPPPASPGNGVPVPPGRYPFQPSLPGTRHD